MRVKEIPVFRFPIDDEEIFHVNNFFVVHSIKVSMVEWIGKQKIENYTESEALKEKFEQKCSVSFFENRKKKFE